MTENSGTSTQSSGQPSGSSGSQPRRGATPAVFGDGSTKEQQEAQIKAAKETNALIKEAGDAEREARKG